MNRISEPYFGRNFHPCKATIAARRPDTMRLPRFLEMPFLKLTHPHAFRRPDPGVGPVELAGVPALDTYELLVPGYFALNQDYLHFVSERHPELHLRDSPQ